MKISDAYLMVREFHRVANHPPRGMTREELRTLRAELIMEECREAADAIMGVDVARYSGRVGPWSRPAVAKELADILVVTYGAADVFSIPLDDVLSEVHKSNMTKDFEAPRRADGKVMKGATYRPPDLTWV